MATALKDRLSVEEKRALKTWADEHGRTWKEKLRHAWEKATYPWSLRQYHTIERRSQLSFDLSITGKDARGGDYSAWFVLACIHDLVRWTTPEVAMMTDYPEMAVAGDWSGVRDTDEKRLREIFIKFVGPQIR